MLNNYLPHRGVPTIDFQNKTADELRDPVYGLSVELLLECIEASNQKEHFNETEGICKMVFEENHNFRNDLQIPGKRKIYPKLFSTTEDFFTPSNEP